MTYTVFILLLALAALLWGGLRLFKINATFEQVFYVMANVVIMLPVAVMCVGVYLCVAVVLLMILAGVLSALGQSSLIDGLSTGWLLILTAGALAIPQSYILARELFSVYRRNVRL